MTSRVKSAFVLLGTLAIGIALGSMMWSTIHTRQMEKIRELRDQEHPTLVDIIVGIVEPVDEAQRIMVEAAVSDYQSGMSSIYDEMKITRRKKSDELSDQLSGFLNPVQQKNFEDWLDRNRRRYRSGSRSDSTKSNKE